MQFKLPVKISSESSCHCDYTFGTTASQAYGRAAELQPSRLLPRVQAGLIQTALGNAVAAEASFGAARELDPGHAAALTGLSAALLASARSAAAQGAPGVVYVSCNFKHHHSHVMHKIVMRKMTSRDARDDHAQACSSCTVDPHLHVPACVTLKMPPCHVHAREVLICHPLQAHVYACSRPRTSLHHWPHTSDGWLQVL